MPKLLFSVPFWATVCKTVRPILSDRCLSVCPVLSVLSVCNVGVLWPNGWMDQMKLGKQVGLGPGHIVLDADPALLPQRGTAFQFSTHICCGQMAGWIKMPPGMQVDLDPGHTVLDGDPAPPKGHSPQFSAHICCGQTAGWHKMALGREVDLGPVDIVLDGDRVPPKRGTAASPLFGLCLLWPNGRPSQLLLLSPSDFAANL